VVNNLVFDFFAGKFSQKMPRGFDFWFGGIDLNQPANQGFTAGRNDNEAGTLLVILLGNILMKLILLGSN
jgi:hypothetical protein